MSELPQLTRPVVSTGTGLDADQTGRQFGKEFYNLTAAKLPPMHDLAIRCDSMDLEHVLGDVEANPECDHGTLLSDTPLSSVAPGSVHTITAAACATCGSWSGLRRCVRA